MFNRKPFKRFLSHYQPDAGDRPAPLRLPPPFVASGFDELMSQFSGATFNQGIYRLHTQSSGELGNRLAGDAFPEFAHRIHCFAYNWLGDQYALDLERREHGECLILMLDVGAGEALKLPVTFSNLHDGEMVDSPDAAVVSSFFESWASQNRYLLPLAPTDCVGYKVPLFLGGEDTIETLEVTDMDVYWTLLGQLRVGLGGHG